MRISDWSSDVCSPDLPRGALGLVQNLFARVPQTVEKLLPLRIDRIAILLIAGIKLFDEGRIGAVEEGGAFKSFAGAIPTRIIAHQIGRATCRERVCQYV